MKETIFKRRSDDAPFTVAGHEIFDCISDDPNFIEQRIAEVPPLCMVANKDLNDLQIHNIVSDYYVYLVEYGGEQCLGVAGGFYKNEMAVFDKIDPKLSAKCNSMKKWVNGGDRETPVLVELIEDPLCILISDELEPIRREMLKKTWETIQVEHDGKDYDAIACPYFNPDYDPGPGRVISQSFRLQPTAAEG